MATFDDIKKFIDQEIGSHDYELGENTLIEDDLGITGMEAVELIDRFALKFNVDTELFKPERYFYPEPGLFVSFSKKVEPLTLGDLALAAREGKLDDTVIGQEHANNARSDSFRLHAECNLSKHFDQKK